MMKYREVKGILPVTWNEVAALWFEIGVEGLKPAEGEEDQSKANAALLLGRILFKMEETLEFVLSELESCGGRHSVPTEGSMLVGIAEEDEAVLSVLLAALQNTLEEEYRDSLEHFCITLKRTEPQGLPGLHPVDLQKSIFYLIQLPEGVQKTSGARSSRPELLCHVTGVELLPGGLHCSISVGSTSESAGEMLTEKIAYLTEFLGGEIYTDHETASDSGASL
ncbi:MAG: hypothetical protein Q4B85_01745 [Lachnospiraceae bacterium]|nr:hypothetical protein [Lachnospiraceae bacterium]